MDQDSLKLTLVYQPERFVEKVGNLLHIVGRQAEHDLFSAAERLREQHRHDGHLPPMGGGLGQH
ncbi:hypothetical protein JOE31_000792 [Arthrobacter sp. PvP023]|uniref:hypothetical protein n=1 Tax=Micrococcaceae TaxID=1268 RepID=UPI001B5C672D|nr:hypothetical protein [Arthrobacter sp. PvP023]MBP1134560.1 hypothetical protein [Arthrobacter sp. PvP023]